MTRAAVAAALLALLAAGAAARGEYMAAETREVPVERLVANLERKLAAAPEDPALWHHLARVHAAAYSRKAEALRVEERTPEVPFFGYDPDYVPFHRVAPAETEAARAAARRHLERAIECYARARRLAPEDPVVTLGYAWTLDQSGADERARELYREVVDAAWEEEGEAESGGLRGFLTVEAAGYLLALLDPEEDAAERAELEERVAHLQSLPRPITPLAVPLADHAGPEDLIDRARPVRFDLDGSGRRLRWSWITPDAAWLVYDPTNSGRIDSARSLFGSRTFLLFCRDGFEALALLDDDGDGALAGPELQGLALWRDADRDGASDAGEVRPLEAWGIVGLACAPSGSLPGASGPHLVAADGVRLADGTTRPCYDLLLDAHPE